jgi:serine protease Do
VPINAGARRILEVLLRGEEVEYGFLGILPVTAGGEQKLGVLLENVAPGSPAERDGQLRLHDVLLAIDGVPLQDRDDLFVQLGTRLAGSKIRLRVRRTNGKDETVQVTLAKLYVPGKSIASVATSRPFVRGLRVDYTSLLAQQPPRLSRIPMGVLITDVQPGSVAESARLKPGEVITQVNGRSITAPDGFYQMTQLTRGPLELTLHSYAPNEPAAKVVLK